MHGQYAYLTFNVADLSSAAGASCAAVLSHSEGPSLKSKVYKKSWFHDIGHQLACQDNQPAFQLMAARFSTECAPIVLKSKMQKGKTGDFHSGNHLLSQKSQICEHSHSFHLCLFKAIRHNFLF